MSMETQEPGSAQAEVPVRADVAAGDSAPALNRDILDALVNLVKCSGDVGHSIAAEFRLAPHEVLALVKLECGLPMKELAQRMGCDASFITTIADNLERRGLLHREPDQRDRRVKNLFLTDEGTAARERLLTLLAQRMPWCYALTEEQRHGFLALLRTMLDTPDPEAGRAGTGDSS